MELHLYPLIFEPLFKKRLWGGKRASAYLGMQAPQSTSPIGEWWMLSDRPDSQSLVKNGPYTGLTLRELVASFPGKIVGDRHKGDYDFPLIVKLVDAGRRLSLQVHPDELVAPKYPGAQSKNEVWYVLEHDEHAQVIAGLRHDKTQLQFRTRVGTDELDECVQIFPSRAGDAYYLPAGTVHSIGSGNLILEIQQNSDTTFRIHDWGRIDENGQARDLHVEEALESIHFKNRALPLVRADDSAVTANKKRDLVRSNKYFKCEEIKLIDLFFGNTSSKTFHVIVSVDNDFTISTDGGEFEIPRGFACLLPSALGSYKVIPHSGKITTLLRTMLSM